MIPPVELMYDGPAEDWLVNGLEFLDHYITIGRLKFDERMLDVGSGLGRKTIPLLGYLLTGSYEGFDCKEIGVKWCQENIVADNFKFQYVDVYAPGYNPKGLIYPNTFRFPFEDNEFDFVVANSVFTHMQYPGVERYMREIHRVLKPGGRCFITWFLWDKSVPPPIFKYRHAKGWYANKDLIEEAIAFDREAIKRLYLQSRLLVRRIEKGSWSGCEGLSHQDIILAGKP